MFYFKNFKVDKNDLLIGTISLKIVLNKKRESYIVFTFINVAVWGTKNNKWGEGWWGVALISSLPRTNSL